MEREYLNKVSPLELILQLNNSEAILSIEIMLDREYPRKQSTDHWVTLEGSATIIQPQSAETKRGKPLLTSPFWLLRL